MANTTVFHPFPPLTGNEAAFQPPGPHVYQLIITTTVFTVLAIACVSGRVFSKTRGPNVPKWGWDDTLCLVAMAGVIAYVGIVLKSVDLGATSDNTTGSNTTSSNQYFLLSLIIQVLYGPLIALIKIALFLLYLRIFAYTRWLSVMVYIGIATTAVFYLTSAVIQTAYCTPLPGSSWTALTVAETTGTSKCNNIATLCTIQAAFNIASDIYVFILPIPAVWQLDLKPSRKLGVLSIFAIGLLAIAASTMSLVSRIQQPTNNNLTFEMLRILITAIVEMDVGIICSCMPAVASLLYRRWSKRSSTRYSGTSGVSHRSTMIRISETKAQPDEEVAMKELMDKWDPILEAPVKKTRRGGLEDGDSAAIRMSRAQELAQSSRDLLKLRADASREWGEGTPQTSTPNWREAHQKHKHSSLGAMPSPISMLSPSQRVNSGSVIAETWYSCEDDDGASDLPLSPRRG